MLENSDVLGVLCVWKCNTTHIEKNSICACGVNVCNKDFSEFSDHEKSSNGIIF